MLIPFSSSLAAPSDHVLDLAFLPYVAASLHVSQRVACNTSESFHFSCSQDVFGFLVFCPGFYSICKYRSYASLINLGFSTDVHVFVIKYYLPQGSSYSVGFVCLISNFVGPILTVC